MAEKRESFNPLLKSYPDSEKVNACSLGAETIFTRLIAQSDDYAHYYAEPRMVLAKLYTLRMVNGEVSASDVEGWLMELAREGLIVCYETGDSFYSPDHQIMFDAIVSGEGTPASRVYAASGAVE